jgi:hypothetical protein
LATHTGTATPARPFTAAALELLDCPISTSALPAAADAVTVSSSASVTV